MERINLVIVGCQHRVESADKMRFDRDWATKVRLESEPQNVFDKDAVAFIYLDEQDTAYPVGYVARQYLPEVHDLLAKHNSSELEFRLTNAKTLPPKAVKGLGDDYPYLTILHWFELEVTLK